MLKTLSKESGFTLIEIVVTIIIAVFVLMIMALVTGETISGSIKPIQELKKNLELHNVMENIHYDYFQSVILAHGDNFTLRDLQKKIGPQGKNITDVTMGGGYFPYGWNGDNFTPYYVEKNEFVVDELDKDKKIIEFKKTENNDVSDFLLVSIKDEKSSSRRLTAIFSKFTFIPTRQN